MNNKGLDILVAGIFLLLSIFGYVYSANAGTLPSNVTVYSYGPNGLVAKTQDEEISYYHKDHIGSNSMVSDSSGEVVYRSDYYPFGEAYGEAYKPERKERYTYTSKEKDSSGLYYYGARYYDAELGRFISADPVKDYSTSPYVYVRNNPLRYVDPNGEDPETGLNILAVGYDWYSINQWDSSTSLWTKVIDVTFLATDSIALFGPFIPGPGEFRLLYALAGTRSGVMTAEVGSRLLKGTAIQRLGLHLPANFYDNIENGPSEPVYDPDITPAEKKYIETDYGEGFDAMVESLMNTKIAGNKGVLKYFQDPKNPYRFYWESKDNVRDYFHVPKNVEDIKGWVRNRYYDAHESALELLKPYLNTYYNQN